MPTRVLNRLVFLVVSPARALNLVASLNIRLADYWERRRKKILRRKNLAARSIISPQRPARRPKDRPD